MGEDGVQLNSYKIRKYWQVLIGRRAGISQLVKELFDPGLGKHDTADFFLSCHEARDH